MCFVFLCVFVCVLQVNEQQLKRQLDEITYIIKLRDNLNPKTGPVSMYLSSIEKGDESHQTQTHQKEMHHVAGVERVAKQWLYFLEVMSSVPVDAVAIQGHVSRRA